MIVSLEWLKDYTDVNVDPKEFCDKMCIRDRGKSGIAAVQAMVKLGANVTVQDSKNVNEIDSQLVTFLQGKGVEFCLGEIPENVDKFDMLILSPGVDPELPFVDVAAKSGAEIIGELEIAFRIARGHFVAITGTCLLYTSKCHYTGI